MEKNQNVNNEETELDINHLMQIRREKLRELQEQGKNPFEITKFDRTNTAGEIKENYEEYEQKDVTVAGRIIDKRIMGKASFCTIQDSDEKIQSYVSINDLHLILLLDFDCFGFLAFLSLLFFLYKKWLCHSYPILQNYYNVF